MKANLINPDSNYECVLLPQANLVSTLNSETFTLQGIRVKLPTPVLFIANDGSVFVEVKKRNEKVEYASLKSLIETVNRTQIIENFSR